MHNEMIVSKGKYAHAQPEMLISLKQYMFVRDENGKKKLLLRFLNERNERCTGFEFVLSLMDARGKLIREERFESAASYYDANDSFGFDHPIPVDERCTDFRVRLLRVSFGDYTYHTDRVDTVVSYERAKRLNTATGAEKSRRAPRIHTRKIRLPWLCAIIALFVLAAVFATFGFLLYNFMDGKTMFSLDGVQYEFVGGDQDSTEVEIIGYSGLSGDVLLPSEIDGRRVIGIRQGAFQGNFRVRNVRIENLDVPNHAFRNCGNMETLELVNVTSIGVESFYNCNSLLSVKSDTMENIGERAFYECDNLLNVELTNADTTKMLSIGKEAFANCSSLANVGIYQTTLYLQGQNLFTNDIALQSLYLNNFYYTIPESEMLTSESGKLTALFGGVQAADIASLQSVTIGYMDAMAPEFCEGFPALQSVTVLKSDIPEIPKRAFRNCASLSVISLPNAVQVVGEEAFKGTALKQFNGGSLQSIGNSAFANCTELTDVLIMSEGLLASIGDSAFAGCSSLRSITIPELVKELPQSMMRGCSSLQSVVFAEKSAITSISQQAFASCSSLQTIYLPSTVTTVMEGAFFGCSQLASVVTQGKLTEYGESAFENCTSLAELPLEDLITIGDWALASTALVNVTVPHSVENIGVGAFARCQQLEAINVPFLGSRAVGGTDHFSYIFGVQAPTDIENISLIPQSLKSVTVSGELTVLPSYAFFGCSGVESFNFRDTIVGIGEWAFAYCNALTEYDLSEVVEIGENAFRASGLRAATLPEIIVDVPDGLFADCSQLETIALATQTSEIGEEAFLNCAVLAQIELPESVTQIDAHAFEGCAALTSVTLPTVIRTISEYTFKGCTSLSNVVLPGILENIGGSAFEMCSSLTNIVLPSTLSTIEVSAFEACTALTGIEFPMGMRSLGGRAFANTALYEVTLPSNVFVGEGAFAECNNIQQITIPFVGANAGSSQSHLGHLFGGEDNTVVPASLKKVFVQGGRDVIIYAGAFMGCQNVEEIVFGDCVEVIQDNAVSNCPRLLYVSLDDSVESVGTDAFANCYRLFEIEDLTGNYADRFKYRLEIRSEKAERSVRVPVDGYLFAQYDEKWYLIDYDAQLENHTSIPKLKYQYDYHQWSVPAYMFYENSVVKTISFSSYVEGVGENAFASSSIEKIEFEGSAPVYKIHENTFADSTKLHTVVLPNAVECIESSAFSNCGALATLGLPNSLREIGKDAFYECDALQSIELPNTVESIGETAFYRCSSLETLVLSENLTTLGKAAFIECPKLKVVTFGSQLTAILKQTFYGCGSLTQVTLPADLEYIGESAFDGCDELRKIMLPDAVSTIDECAFRDCVLLDQVSFGENLNSIGAAAFFNCGSLKQVLLFDSVESVGASAFFGCASLERVSLGDKLKYIENAAFGNCIALENASLGSSVIEIGNSAFAGCCSLTAITLPDTVTYLGDAAFNNCDALTSVTLSAKLEEINANTFNDCDALTEIVIPELVGKIESCAFNHCDALTKVVLPENLEQIGEGAFIGCTQLYDVYYSGTALKDSIKAGRDTNGYVAYYAVAVHTDMDEPASVEVIVDDDLVFRRAGDQWLLIQYTGNRTELALKDLSYNGDSVANILIKKALFANNTALTKLVLGDEVKWMQNSVFENCDSLIEVVIEGNGLTELPQNVFFSCEKLQTVTLADSIHTIGQWAFYDCYRLQSIVMPASLKKIGGQAFYNCSRLLSITLGEKVESIGYEAFWNCVQLYEVIDLSESRVTENYWDNSYVTLNAKEVFDNLNDAFQRMVVDGCTFVCIDGDWYLHACNLDPSLETLELPETIMKSTLIVMEHAFEGVTLQNIFLPASLEIDDSELQSISGLKNIYFAGSYGQWRNTYPDAMVWYYDTCIHIANMQKWTYDKDGNVQTELCALIKKVLTEPTCDSEGVEVFICDCDHPCGYQENKTAIPALGHEYDELGKCTKCGDELPRTELSDSAWTQWKTDGFVLGEGFEFSENKLVASSAEVGYVATLTFTAKDNIRLIFTYGCTPESSLDILQIFVNGVLVESDDDSINVLLEKDNTVEIRYEKVEEDAEGEDPTLAWIQDLYFISY